MIIQKRVMTARVAEKAMKIGPAAGMIGKVAPKAAPYAAKIASGLRIVVSRMPIA